MPRAMALARNLDIDESGASQIPVAASCVMKWYYYSNQNAAVIYLKIYDQATAADENDTPVLTLPLPATSAANVGLPVEGLWFGTGVAMRATTGVADNDTGAPGANDVVINFAYNLI